jgi:hypothetical protein
MVLEAANQFRAELAKRRIAHTVPERSAEKVRIRLKAPYSEELHALATQIARERERAVGHQYMILVGAFKGEKSHDVWFSRQEYGPPRHSATTAQGRPMKGYRHR